MAEAVQGNQNRIVPMIGILAYGSLIDDPGREIEPLIIRRLKGVETPFQIEFARSSSTRDGAPTLIPGRMVVRLAGPGKLQGIGTDLC